MAWPLLILMGFGTGAYGVLVGAGGGFILGPLLLLFMDLEPEVVAGTVLASVAVNSISGALRVPAHGGNRLPERPAFRRGGHSRLGDRGLRRGAGRAHHIPRPSSERCCWSWPPHIAFRTTLPESAGTPNPKTTSWRQPCAADTSARRRADGVTATSFNELFATSFNLVLGFISSFFGTGGGFPAHPDTGVVIRVFRCGSPRPPPCLPCRYTRQWGLRPTRRWGHVEWFSGLSR